MTLCACSSGLAVARRARETSVVAALQTTRMLDASWQLLHAIDRDGHTALHSAGAFSAATAPHA